ncbi:MAG: DUF86 domain-containing protein [Myxococcales bacterium]|nr:DUF86 domain-containing protein [Myxococcales bacterium]
MTDHLIILKKLAMLREHAGRVRRRRPPARETFETDVDIQDALALSFLVAVQEANDIAMHIAADEGWGVPGSYAEAFELLANNSVLTREHARQLGGIASVRNRIAHGYASIDPGRLWDELPAGLEALERYVDAIARLVGDPP